MSLRQDNYQASEINRINSLGMPKDLDYSERDDSESLRTHKLQATSNYKDFMDNRFGSQKRGLDEDNDMYSGRMVFNDWDAISKISENYDPENPFSEEDIQRMVLQNLGLQKTLEKPKPTKMEDVISSKKSCRNSQLYSSFHAVGGRHFGTSLDIDKIDEEIYIEPNYLMLTPAKTSTREENCASIHVKGNIRVFVRSNRQLKRKKVHKKSTKFPDKPYKKSFQDFCSNSGSVKNLQEAYGFTRDVQENMTEYDLIRRTLNAAKDGNPFRRLVNCHLMIKHKKNEPNMKFVEPTLVQPSPEKNNYSTYLKISKDLANGRDCNVINVTGLNDRQISALIISTTGSSYYHTGKKDLYLGGFEIPPEVQGKHTLYLLGYEGGGFEFDGDFSAEDIEVAISVYVTNMALQEEADLAAIHASLLFVADGLGSYSLPNSNGLLDLTALALSHSITSVQNVPNPSLIYNSNLESAMVVRANILAMLADICSEAPVHSTIGAAYYAQSEECRRSFYAFFVHQFGDSMSIVDQIDPLNLTSEEIVRIRKAGPGQHMWSTDGKTALENGCLRFSLLGRTMDIDLVKDPRKKQHKDVVNTYLNLTNRDGPLHISDKFNTKDLSRLKSDRQVNEVSKTLAEGPVGLRNNGIRHGFHPNLKDRLTMYPFDLPGTWKVSELPTYTVKAKPRFIPLQYDCDSYEVNPEDHEPTEDIEDDEPRIDPEPEEEEEEIDEEFKLPEDDGKGKDIPDPSSTSQKCNDQVPPTASAKEESPKCPPNESANKSSGTVPPEGSPKPRHEDVSGANESGPQFDEFNYMSHEDYYLSGIPNDSVNYVAGYSNMMPGIKVRKVYTNSEVEDCAAVKFIRIARGNPKRYGVFLHCYNIYAMHFKYYNPLISYDLVCVMKLTMEVSTDSKLDGLLASVMKQYFNIAHNYIEFAQHEYRVLCDKVTMHLDHKVPFGMIFDKFQPKDCGRIACLLVQNFNISHVLDPRCTRLFYQILNLPENKSFQRYPRKRNLKMQSIGGLADLMEDIGYFPKVIEVPDYLGKFILRDKRALFDKLFSEIANEVGVKIIYSDEGININNYHHEKWTPFYAFTSCTRAPRSYYAQVGALEGIFDGVTTFCRGMDARPRVDVMDMIKISDRLDTMSYAGMPK